MSMKTHVLSKPFLGIYFKERTRQMHKGYKDAHPSTAQSRKKTEPAEHMSVNKRLLLN